MNERTIANPNRKLSRDRGRPSAYTPEIGDRICEGIARGKSLRKVCQAADLPAASTVIGWVATNAHEGFSEQYARARRIQAELLADELLEIADDASDDLIGTDEGLKLNKEPVARSRLRLDTRKWMLAKMLPKVYGDRISMELRQDCAGASPYDGMSVEDLRARLGSLMRVHPAASDEARVGSPNGSR